MKKIDHGKTKNIETNTRIYSYTFNNAEKFAYTFKKSALEKK